MRTRCTSGAHSSSSLPRQSLRRGTKETTHSLLTTEYATPHAPLSVTKSFSSPRILLATTAAAAYLRVFVIVSACADSGTAYLAQRKRGHCACENHEDRRATHCGRDEALARARFLPSPEQHTVCSAQTAQRHTRRAARPSQFLFLASCAPVLLLQRI